MSENKEAELFKAVEEGLLAEVVRLLHEGADINARNSYGMTVLHEAVLYDQTEVAKLLISKGADVSAVDIDVSTGAVESGTTPLHWAAYKGNIESAELLISKGADVNAERPIDNDAPIDWAGYNSPMSELLRKHGAKDWGSR